MKYSGKVEGQDKIFIEISNQELNDILSCMDMDHLKNRHAGSPKFLKAIVNLRKTIFDVLVQASK